MAKISSCHTNVQVCKILYMGVHGFIWIGLWNSKALGNYYVQGLVRLKICLGMGVHGSFLGVLYGFDLTWLLCMSLCVQRDASMDRFKISLFSKLVRA